nr:hypothetical protein [Candidatus Njordarchaeota archaeon]
MIGARTGGYYDNSVGTSDSADLKPDYPMSNEPPEKRVRKLMANQSAPIMPQTNIRLALTILGLMLLLNGMLVVGTIFLASVAVKPVQTTITRFLYKQPEM